MSQIVWEVAVETDTLPPVSPPVPVTFAIYAGTPGRDGAGGTSAVISPSTPTQSLTATYLLRVSADGTHVDQLNPNTFDAAGTAATSMAAHLAAPDPHSQYALDADLSAFAPRNSPTFTGTPTAPTATSGTSTAQLATTQFVSIAVSAIPAANITAGTFSGAYVFAAPPRLTVGPTSAPVVLRSSAYSDSVRPGDVLKYERGPTTGVVLVRDGANSFEFNPDNQFYNTTLNRLTLTTLFLSGVVAQLDGYAGVDGVTSGWHLTQYTGNYMCFGGFDYQGWGFSSTNTKRRLSGSKSTFFGVNTDATYKGHRQHYIQDATGSRNTFREWSDGSRGYTAFTVHTTAPADADLNTSEALLYTDGTTLYAKLKNAASSVYTINLSGGGGGGVATNGRTIADSSPIASDIIVLVASARGSGAIAGIYGAKTASGTVVATLKINGTAVAGVNGVTLSSTLQNVSATGANTYTTGDRITLEYGTTSTPANLELTVGGI